MKRCSTCGIEKPRSEFYARSGRCKPCHIAAATRRNQDNKNEYNHYQREYQREYRRQRPELVKAHNTLNNAIIAGKVVRPSHCDECGNEAAVEGHHEDYDKPLDVQWLCATCHGRHHREERLVS